MIFKITLFALLFSVSTSYAQDVDIKNKTVIAKFSDGVHYVYISPSGKIFSTFVYAGTKSSLGPGGVEYDLGKTTSYSRSETIPSTGTTLITNFVATAKLSGKTLKMNHSSQMRFQPASQGVPGLKPNAGSSRIDFDGDVCTFFNQTISQDCKVVSGNVLPP